MNFVCSTVFIAIFQIKKNHGNLLNNIRLEKKSQVITYNLFVTIYFDVEVPAGNIRELPF